MARKYQMTRLGAGDYILPSNDGTVLFRIVRIDEVDNDRPVKVWSVYVYDTPVEEIPEELPEDFIEWNRWNEISHWHPTRKAAIDDALTYGSANTTGAKIVFDDGGSAKLWIPGWPS